MGAGSGFQPFPDAGKGEEVSLQQLLTRKQNRKQSTQKTSGNRLKTIYNTTKQLQIRGNKRVCPPSYPQGTGKTLMNAYKRLETYFRGLSDGWTREEKEEEVAGASTGAH